MDLVWMLNFFALPISIWKSRTAAAEHDGGFSGQVPNMTTILAKAFNMHPQDHQKQSWIICLVDWRGNCSLAGWRLAWDKALWAEIKTWVSQRKEGCWDGKAGHRSSQGEAASAPQRPQAYRLAREQEDMEYVLQASEIKDWYQRRVAN